MDKVVSKYALYNFILATISMLIIYSFLFNKTEQYETGARTYFVLFGSIHFVLAMTAGIGLKKLKRWGYYFNIYAAIVSAYSLLGIIYTIYAIHRALDKGFINTLLGKKKGKVLRYFSRVCSECGERLAFCK